MKGRAVSFSTISSIKWSYDYGTVNLNEALLSDIHSAVARTASMSVQSRGVRRWNAAYADQMVTS